VRHVLALKDESVDSDAFTHRGLHAADFDLLAASWRQVALIVRAQIKSPDLAASDRFILSDILSGLALHSINTVEQRSFNQRYGDLTRGGLHISDSARTAFETNRNTGCFDAVWLRHIAAFRPIHAAPLF
jgi:hypothetical protein